MQPDPAGESAPLSDPDGTEESRDADMQLSLLALAGSAVIPALFYLGFGTHGLQIGVAVVGSLWIAWGLMTG